jgi:hypothetical protein
MMTILSYCFEFLEVDREGIVQGVPADVVRRVHTFPHAIPNKSLIPEADILPQRIVSIC